MSAPQLVGPMLANDLTASNSKPSENIVVQPTAMCIEVHLVSALANIYVIYEPMGKSF